MCLVAGIVQMLLLHPAAIVGRRCCGLFVVHTKLQLLSLSPVIKCVIFVVVFFLQAQGYSFRVMDDGAVSSMIAEHDAERPTLYNTQQQRDNLLVRVMHAWEMLSLPVRRRICLFVCMCLTRILSLRCGDCAALVMCRGCAQLCRGAFPAVCS